MANSTNIVVLRDHEAWHGNISHLEHTAVSWKSVSDNDNNQSWIENQRSQVENI